ncbi:MAG: protein-glutamate O-methyltransferase CheR [Planctomycetes bacterium]|nr:protein-glutamate O-methyltransferase CheR [Planctomycetota bacterium]
MRINAEDFQYVADVVRTEAAIVLEAGKEYLVETRLGPVAHQLGLGSIGLLVTELRQRRNPALLTRVIDAMTTNETSFFRDVQPFEHLKRKVFPELIERRRNEKRISIWCAAASSGQEPYSMAMLLRENFPELENWRVEFLATDISTQVLAKAREGLYSQLEVNRGLPAPLLVKYFHKQGHEWRIDARLRSAIEWREFNLAAPTYPSMGPFDLIMLRNVMIYFDVPMKRSILSNMRRALRPDGYLFLGTAETTINVDESFASDTLHTACYRLKSA